MRRLLATLLLSAGTLFGLPACLRAADAPELVIVDNDFSGPGGSDLQSISFSSTIQNLMCSA